MSIRDVKTQTLIEQIVCYVADDIHYGGGPRMQEIAGELADKYPFLNAAPQLLEACKATKLAIFKEPPERSARWGEVARIIEAALAAAEKE